MEEEDEIQAQACKFPRFGNGGRNDHPINNKIVPRDHHNILHNEDVENIGGEVRTRRGVGGIGDGGTTTIPPTTANNNRLHNWHHSSRIIRVSRASGGKDRHSKVMTSKGLRDRRVRLSVTTAIQFYDLQDRLGYDQPSKAVEWLIKSAADAISELPSLNNTFPDTPKQLSDEKRGDLGLIEQGFADDSADAELDHGDEGNYNNNNQQQQNQSQNLSLSKSACSSTSETSKGSGLSLSRSDIRVKARERARERAAKEKKKDTNTNTNNESLHQINAHHQHHQNMNPVSQTASFTELLTGGINNAAVQTTNSPTGSVHQNHGSDEPNNLFNKAAARQQQQQQWGSAPMEMDYFSPLFLGASSSSRTQQHHHQSSSSGFSSAPQFQLGHSLAEAMSFNVVSGGDSQNQNQNHHHHSSADQMQLPFSFIHDHLMPAVVTSSHQHPGGNNTNSHNHNNNDYNLNFTMLSSSSSLGLAGYNNNNRGTLQSNSSHPSSNNNNNNNNNLLPHHHHHLQRFSVPTMDGSTVPFFFGAAAAAAPVASAAAAMESHNHHQHQLFSPVFDGRLQLCYGGGDGSRHSDQKGKAKN